MQDSTVRNQLDTSLIETLKRQQLINVDGVNLKAPIVRIRSKILENSFKGFRDKQEISEFINQIFNKLQTERYAALKRKEEKISINCEIRPFNPVTSHIQNFLKKLSIELSFTKVGVSQLDRTATVDIGMYTATTDINNHLLIPSTPDDPQNKVTAATFIEDVMNGEQDSEILSHCKAFAESNPFFGENLDLSKNYWTDLIFLQRATRDYLLPKLEQNIFKAIKNSILLDQKFAVICEGICISKDSRLKAFFLSILKEKPDLLADLRSGKNNEYKTQWKAFKKLCTTIEI